MVTEVDWVERLRTTPCEVCPSEADLQAFFSSPEEVTPAAFAHIIGGCTECRSRLQQIALHPSVDEIRSYLDQSDDVPDEVVFHCIDCQLCQDTVRELLDE